MTGRKLRLDALVRVSQRGDREELRSPDQQRAENTQCAAKIGATIVKEHVSLDVSGKTMDRKDVDAVLARIRNGDTDGVIVAWLDRFSRAPVDQALRVFNDIQAAGGKVVAADMSGIDPKDPTGEFAISVMLSVNRLNWRKVAERYDMSIRDAIKDGKAVGGAIFGYRFTDPTPRGKRGVADSHLVAVEELRDVVRGLFERKAQGATWLELARWLDAAAPKAGGAKWHRNTVRGIIASRTYLGEVRHGKHRNPNAHEPLVPLALWRRAQAEPGRRTPRGTYLLTGLARCAGCGRRLKGGSLGSYRGARRIYSCDNRNCTERSTVIAARLDEEVSEQFIDHVEGFHLRAAEDGDLADVDTEIKRRTGNVERLAAVVPTHPAAIAAHQAALAEEETELAAAEDQRHQILASQAVTGAVTGLRELWPDRPLDARRELLRGGIDAVFVRRTLSRDTTAPVSLRALVVFRGEGPAEVRDGGRAPIARRWTWDDDVSTLAFSG